MPLSAETVVPEPSAKFTLPELFTTVLFTLIKLWSCLPFTASVEVAETSPAPTLVIFTSPALIPALVTSTGLFSAVFNFKPSLLKIAALSSVPNFNEPSLVKSISFSKSTVTVEPVALVFTLVPPVMVTSEPNFAALVLPFSLAKVIPCCSTLSSLLRLSCVKPTSTLRPLTLVSTPFTPTISKRFLSASLFTAIVEPSFPAAETPTLKSWAAVTPLKSTSYLTVVVLPSDETFTAVF